MKYAFYEYEFGYLKIGFENETVLLLTNAETIDEDNSPCEFTESVYGEICGYLQGTRRKFDFRYELIGTDFQKKVWAELEKIPYGETRSYKDIAIAVGQPKAVRAVGAANNKNPVMIAVPCHRVIGSDGSLTGYAGGLKMKKRLLDIK